MFTEIHVKEDIDFITHINEIQSTHTVKGSCKIQEPCYTLTTLAHTTTLASALVLVLALAFLIAFELFILLFFVVCPSFLWEGGVVFLLASVC